MAEDIGFGRLPHGAKILWESVGHSRTFSLGFFFATGSRFDPPGKAGTAHLVEHLVFKGTTNHSAVSLARLVDRVGGDLNAWTDREELAFTCTVPAESWKVAVEALTELCLHPTFPENEFLHEKEVIRNEILSSLEDPEELSYDHFLQTLSPGDWSRPVAGTEESLADITLEEARAWWAEYGTLDRLTVSFSGGVDPEKIRQALAERLNGIVLPEKKQTAAIPSNFFPSSQRWIQKADFQMIQILGGFSFPVPISARAAAIWQIFSMLWGETMSSRLFQSIREQRGLCYSVTSQVFDSVGTWGLQFFATCAPENTTPLLTALAFEIDRLVSDPPTDEEWDNARSALLGGVILAAEKMENRVGRLWKQFDTYGSALGVEATLNVLSVPVSIQERNLIFESLAKSVPSLLVWGKIPRRFTLPKPWML